MAEISDGKQKESKPGPGKPPVPLAGGSEQALVEMQAAVRALLTRPPMAIAPGAFRSGVAFMRAGTRPRRLNVPLAWRLLRPKSVASRVELHCTRRCSTASGTRRRRLIVIVAILSLVRKSRLS